MRTESQPVVETPMNRSLGERGGASNRLVIWWSLGLFVLAVFSSCATALTRPFWNDEVFTAAIVRLGSVSKIWDALQKGAEQQPPIFYWMTYFASSPRNSEFWMRVPGIAGFLVLLLSLFYFMYRAKGPLAALVSIAVMISSEGLYYASEARPYGALLGCLGLAALLWQGRKRGSHSPVGLVALLFVLTAACALHYFGLFVILVFGLAEVFLGVRSRKPDWPLLFTLPLTLCPLILAMRLIQFQHSQYGGTFWARPSLRSIVAAYKFTFSFPTMDFGAIFHAQGADINLGHLLPASLLLVALGLLFLRARHSDVSLTSTMSLVAPEIVLGIGFLLLPVIVDMAGVLTGAFTARYAIGSLIGAAIVFGWSFATLKKSFGYIFAAALTLLFLTHQSVQDIQRLAQFVHGRGPAVIAQDRFEPIFRRAGAGEPVVIEDAHLFIESVEYAGPEIRPWLLYLQDHRQALKFVGTDTVETANDGIQPYLDLQLVEPVTFLERHRDFVMASRNPGQWLSAYLIQSGAQIQTIERNSQGVSVARVRLPVAIGHNR